MEQFLSKLKSNDKYPPFGLIAGAANIIKIYKIDITNILVPASVANCLSGFNPLLANQQKIKILQVLQVAHIMLRVSHKIQHF